MRPPTSVSPLGMGRDPRHLPEKRRAARGETPEGYVESAAPTDCFGRTPTELTSRTIQGRFLLRPSGRLTQITIGILARAQRLSGAEVHAFVSLSNHLQPLASFVDVQQMSTFEWYVNGNLAREVNRLHDWSGTIWGRRYQPISVSDEEEDQVARLKYIVGQGCVKEGLIASPCDWPGATSTIALCQGRRTMTGIWIDRDALRRARQRGKKVTERDFTTVESLQLSPIPAWAHLDWKAYRERVRDLVHEIEAETSAQNRSLGRTPMGVKRLQEVHPHSRPEQLERTPAPRFHAKSKAAHQALREAFSTFLRLYREAAEKLRNGVLTTEFPIGGFPPRQPFTHPKLVPH